ncbi:MAG: restriction endonuclease subunit S [Candidatus Methylumidiphilus sp.]
MTETKPTAHKVPKLRFPEFWEEGEWKQKLIEDFFDVGSSKRVLQQDWTTQGVPFYRTRELVSLSKNEPFGSEIFISEELFREISINYGMPTEGDFLVSGVGTLGISYQVQAQDRFYFKDGNVLWFKLKSGIVSKFFKYCFEADEIQNQILGQASISTVGTYTIQNTKVTKFTCPQNIEEQQKIADCLSSLDELITAQAQKLDTLKIHKKGLMQQLFPAEGETVPKLRFAQFLDTEEWEEKPLSKISTSIFDGTHQTPKYTKEGIPFFSVENLVSGKLNKFISREDYLISTSKNKPEKGDLLITRIGNIGFSAIVDWEYEFSIYVTLAVVKKTDQFDSYYLHCFFQSERYQTEIRSKSLLNAVPCKINMDELRQTKVLLPTLTEQQKIADCLSSLDELITAQAQKLATLKTHKKGLMQQLFPQTPTESTP